MIFQPHGYQGECIQWLHTRDTAGVFADPGLGKTAILLHYLDDARWRTPGFRALIIAPLRPCYSVWPAEIKKWDLPFSYSILHGKGKELRAEESTDLHIINTENIKWLFKKLPRYTHLVIDESSKFKNYSAVRSETVRDALDEFPKRIILTGTPSPNSLEDLYNQIHILDKGASLGKNVTAFRNRFFHMSMLRKFIEYTPVYGAEETIQRLISPLVMRIDADTHLDVPPIVRNNLYISLPPRIQKLYDGFEKEFFAEFDRHQMVVSSAASSYNVCRQVANGRFYVPAPPLSRVAELKEREVLTAHGLKVEALRELLGELQGKPLLVAYHFKHDLEQLREAFGDVPVLGDGASAKKSDQIIDRWSAGRIPLLLAHPQSVSHGLNLQEGGRDIAWFSLTDNLENYLQFNDRLHRQGASGKTRVHHLVVRRTVDEAILRRLGMKDRNQRAFLKALEEYRRGKLNRSINL